MATFSVAGVYREESQTPPVREFGTGIPAFLGYADAGPDLPYPITRASQFPALFRTSAGSFLAPAVRGFFENGGSLCYVAKLRSDIFSRNAVDLALEKLDETADMDLVCFPDAMSKPDEAIELQQKIVDWCDMRKDCFAILDPLPGASLNAVLAQWQELQGMSAALYFPWLKVSSTSGSGHRSVPPSGHLAGIYARIDREKGVFHPPANTTVEGVFDLTENLTNELQAALDPAGVVNCIRAFPGRGIRVWGARTINGQPAWRQINVRRLFLTLHRWLNLAMASTAFEPNDRLLWARIRRTLTAFLDDLYNRGALAGASPAQAYFVRCDASTIPPAVREAGQVVAEIGVAPVVPSEFIVVRIVYEAGEMRTGEISESPEKET